MQAILDWVKSGLLFGILGSVILMLCPNKTYEKHISFVVGLLFLLVMLHPIMEFFSLDQTTFLHSVENYLMMENPTDKISDGDRKLYEEALSLQLETILKESDGSINRVAILTDESGNVREVILCVEGTIRNIDEIEGYLRNIFGEEVIISYENN